MSTQTPHSSEGAPDGAVSTSDSGAKPTSRLVYLWPSLAGVLWGGSTIACRISVSDLDPIVAATARFGIASLILLPMAIYYWLKGDRLSKGDWFLCFIVGVVGTGAFNLFFYTGLKFTSASEAAVITAATPAATVILAAMFIKESLTRWSLGGSVLSLAGVALVVGGGLSLQGFSTERLIGDSFLIMTMLLWALYNVLTRVSMSRMSPMVLTVYSSLFGFLFLLPFGLWQIIPAGGAHIDISAWTAMAYSAIFSTVLGTTLWNMGLRGAGASRISVFGNISPVTTLLLAALLLQERIGPEHLAGAALVLLGVWLTNRGPVPKVATSAQVSSSRL
jgi:drug/metabolite transporter (DMT)-like permease